MLKSLARTDPYYKRNQPKVCSFFAKGECNRGSECPYRHELPSDKYKDLANQNMQDRYHGRNDPVAKKILARNAESMGLKPPEDPAVVCIDFLFTLVIFNYRIVFQTSLFLSSLPATSNETTIRTAVLQTLPSADQNQLKSVVHVEKTRCAFVNFQDRPSAETAAEAWANGLEIDGQVVSVKWGRSRNKQGISESTS